MGGSKGKRDRVFYSLSNLIPKPQEDSDIRKESTFSAFFSLSGFWLYS